MYFPLPDPKDLTNKKEKIQFKTNGKIIDQIAQNIQSLTFEIKATKNASNGAEFKIVKGGGIRSMFSFEFKIAAADELLRYLKQDENTSYVLVDQQNKFTDKVMDEIDVKDEMLYTGTTDNNLFNDIARYINKTTNGKASIVNAEYVKAKIDTTAIQDFMEKNKLNQFLLRYPKEPLYSDATLELFAFENANKPQGDIALQFDLPPSNNLNFKFELIVTDPKNITKVEPVSSTPETKPIEVGDIVKCKTGVFSKDEFEITQITDKAYFAIDTVKKQEYTFSKSSCVLIRKSTPSITPEQLQQKRDDAIKAKNDAEQKIVQDKADKQKEIELAENVKKENLNKIREEFKVNIGKVVSCKSYGGIFSTDYILKGVDDAKNQLEVEDIEGTDIKKHTVDVGKCTVKEITVSEDIPIGSLVVDISSNIPYLLKKVITTGVYEVAELNDRTKLHRITANKLKTVDDLDPIPVNKLVTLISSRQKLSDKYGKIYLVKDNGSISGIKGAYIIESLNDGGKNKFDVTRNEIEVFEQPLEAYKLKPGDIVKCNAGLVTPKFLSNKYTVKAVNPNGTLNVTDDKGKDNLFAVSQCNLSKGLVEDTRFNHKYLPENISTLSTKLFNSNSSFIENIALMHKKLLPIGGARLSNKLIKKLVPEPTKEQIEKKTKEEIIKLVKKNEEDLTKTEIEQREQEKGELYAYYNLDYVPSITKEVAKLLKEKINSNNEYYISIKNKYNSLPKQLQFDDYLDLLLNGKTNYIHLNSGIPNIIADEYNYIIGVYTSDVKDKYTLKTSFYPAKVNEDTKIILLVQDVKEKYSLLGLIDSTFSDRYELSVTELNGFIAEEKQNLKIKKQIEESLPPNRIPIRSLKQIESNNKDRYSFIRSLVMATGRDYYTDSVNDETRDYKRDILDAVNKIRRELKLNNPYYLNIKEEFNKLYYTGNKTITASNANGQIELSKISFDKYLKYLNGEVKDTIISPDYLLGVGQFFAEYLNIIILIYTYSEEKPELILKDKIIPPYSNVNPRVVFLLESDDNVYNILSLGSLYDPSLEETKEWFSIERYAVHTFNSNDKIVEKRNPEIIYTATKALLGNDYEATYIDQTDNKKKTKRINGNEFILSKYNIDYFSLKYVPLEIGDYVVCNNKYYTIKADGDTSTQYYALEDDVADIPANYVILKRTECKLRPFLVDCDGKFYHVLRKLEMGKKYLVESNSGRMQIDADKCERLYGDTCTSLITRKVKERKNITETEYRDIIRSGITDIDLSVEYIKGCLRENRITVNGSYNYPQTEEDAVNNSVSVTPTTRQSVSNVNSVISSTPMSTEPSVSNIPSTVTASSSAVEPAADIEVDVTGTSQMLQQQLNARQQATSNIGATANVSPPVDTLSTAFEQCKDNQEDVKKLKLPSSIKKVNTVKKEIPDDGYCFYRAVDFAVLGEKYYNQLSTIENYKETVRNIVANILYKLDNNDPRYTCFETIFNDKNARYREITIGTGNDAIVLDMEYREYLEYLPGDKDYVKGRHNISPLQVWPYPQLGIGRFLAEHYKVAIVSCDESNDTYLVNDEKILGMPKEIVENGGDDDTRIVFLHHKNENHYDVLGIVRENETPTDESYARTIAETSAILNPTAPTPEPAPTPTPAPAPAPAPAPSVGKFYAGIPPPPGSPPPTVIGRTRSPAPVQPVTSTTTAPAPSKTSMFGKIKNALTFKKPGSSTTPITPDANIVQPTTPIQNSTILPLTSTSMPPNSPSVDVASALHRTNYPVGRQRKSSITSADQSTSSPADQTFQQTNPMVQSQYPTTVPPPPTTLPPADQTNPMLNSSSSTPAQPPSNVKDLPTIVNYVKEKDTTANIILSYVAILLPLMRDSKRQSIPGTELTSVRNRLPVKNSSQYYKLTFPTKFEIQDNGKKHVYTVNSNNKLTLKFEKPYNTNKFTLLPYDDFIKDPLQLGNRLYRIVFEFGVELVSKPSKTTDKVYHGKINIQDLAKPVADIIKNQGLQNRKTGGRRTYRNSKYSLRKTRRNMYGGNDPPTETSKADSNQQTAVPSSKADNRQSKGNESQPTKQTNPRETLKEELKSKISIAPNNYKGGIELFINNIVTIIEQPSIGKESILPESINNLELVNNNTLIIDDVEQVLQFLPSTPRNVLLNRIDDLQSAYRSEDKKTINELLNIGSSSFLEQLKNVAVNMYPLEYAILVGSQRLIEYLLESGADPTLKGDHGKEWTSLAKLRKRGNQEGDPVPKVVKDIIAKKNNIMLNLKRDVQGSKSQVTQGGLSKEALEAMEKTVYYRIRANDEDKPVDEIKYKEIIDLGKADGTAGTFNEEYTIKPKDKKIEQKHNENVVKYYNLHYNLADAKRKAIEDAKLKLAKTDDEIKQYAKDRVIHIENLQIQKDELNEKGVIQQVPEQDSLNVKIEEEYDTAYRVNAATDYNFGFQDGLKLLPHRQVYKLGDFSVNEMVALATGEAVQISPKRIKDYFSGYLNGVNVLFGMNNVNKSLLERTIRRIAQMDGKQKKKYANKVEIAVNDTRPGQKGKINVKLDLSNINTSYGDDGLISATENDIKDILQRRNEINKLVELYNDTYDKTVNPEYLDTEETGLDPNIKLTEGPKGGRRTTKRNNRKMLKK